MIQWPAVYLGTHGTCSGCVCVWRDWDRAGGVMEMDTTEAVLVATVMMKETRLAAQGTP